MIANARVLLISQDVSGAYGLAIGHFARYQNFQNAHYKNTLIGHFIGKLGEYAALRWAEREGLAPQAKFMADDLHCDIYLDTIHKRCEVKTWREHQWEELGHAISEKQFKGVRAKADMVIWCTVYIPIGIRDAARLRAAFAAGTPASVRGWNHLYEFDGIAPTEKRGLISRTMPLDKIHSVYP